MAETLDHDVIDAVRRFVDRDVIPVASELEHADEYPHALVATMRELGLFGATIPVEHGGLGLSFVAWIVKAHGGTVEVESELDKGTRFVVTLPAEQFAAAAEESPALPMPEQVH